MISTLGSILQNGQSPKDLVLFVSSKSKFIAITREIERNYAPNTGYLTPNYISLFSVDV